MDQGGVSRSDIVELAEHTLILRLAIVLKGTGQGLPHARCLTNLRIPLGHWVSEALLEPHCT
jgi:hypothetical protein